MKDLVIFYLITSAIHFTPFVVIALSIQFGSPFSPKELGHGPLDGRSCRRNNGMTQLQEAFLHFDSNTKISILRFTSIAFILQVTTALLICFAIEYDVFLSFVRNVNDLPPGTVFFMLKFSVTTAVIQFIPTFLLVLAIINGIHIPFIPPLQINRVPPSPELVHLEQQNEDGAPIDLIRFKNSEETQIYAKLRDDELGNNFQLVFLQRKEVNARTQCYLYKDNVGFLDQIIPTPFTVNDLEEIFFPGHP